MTLKKKSKLEHFSEDLKNVKIETPNLKKQKNKRTLKTNSKIKKCSNEKQEASG